MQECLHSIKDHFQILKVYFDYHSYSITSSARAEEFSPLSQTVGLTLFKTTMGSAYWENAGSLSFEQQDAPQRYRADPSAALRHAEEGLRSSSW